MISAKVIADSITEQGDRLTTMEVVFHRYILAEFNTHRMFSRNSASSRAIPIEKQLKRIREDLAYPFEFGSNQAGMQAGPPLKGLKLKVARGAWKAASILAVNSAKALMKLGVHKQVTNRLLEPFMWHTVIVTATDYENFFGLRDNALAQPEIHELARLMRRAYRNSQPILLTRKDWHLPYIDEGDWMDWMSWENGTTGDAIGDFKKISAARCARVSYLTHDGKRDFDKDIELYERLTSASPAHASPLEHVATPVPSNTIYFTGVDLKVPVIGNYLGWGQLRHENLLKEIGVL